MDNYLRIYTTEILSKYQNIDLAFRDYLQNVFDWYCSLFGESQLVLDVAGGMVLSLVIFWSIGLIYTALDLTKWPNYFYKFKTQENSKNDVTLSEVLKTAKVSLKNQLTVQLVTTFAYHYLIEFRGMDPSVKVPGLGTTFVHILVFSLIQEITFYYLHRLLHYGKMYKAIHKVHHYWQAPIAIAAVYCHPFEHFLANLVPVLLGPFLLGSHRSTLFVWLVLVHVVTLNDHSGYAFPWMPSPEFHDYHHLKFNQNFGRMGFLDYFHGTSDRYLMLKSNSNKRSKSIKNK